MKTKNASSPKLMKKIDKLLEPAEIKLCSQCNKKPVKFWSEDEQRGYCSDACYDLARKQTRSIEEAQIKPTKDGRAFFQQGDIMFPVDAKDLNNVVGCNGGSNVIDKLMDSQVVTLARANGLTVTPYARELLRPVLTGLVQLVWRRDLEANDSEHLRENQRRRIERYTRELASYSKPADSEDGAPVSQRKRTDWTKTYKLVDARAKTASGRAEQLLGVMKTIKQGTLAQITEAARGKLITKQDLGKMTARFLKELVEAGAVQEAQS